MALDTFIAGAHTATWNAVALGVTQKGYEIQVTTKAELINETDVYGLSTIDWVYRGLNCFAAWISRAWKAGPKAALWPYGGGALGVIASAAAPIGRLASDIAQALVFTSTAATPAVSDPATLTASKALLVPDFDVKWVFDSRLRDIPMRMQLLPYSSTNIITFSVT